MRKTIENELEMKKGYMSVICAGFELEYSLFLPETKKAIELIFVCSTSAGVFQSQGGVFDYDNLNSSIHKGDGITHYTEEVRLKKEDLNNIEKICNLFSEKRADDFLRETKNLVGKIYEKMKTPDELKENRLKACFNRQENKNLEEIK